jgi:L-aspartate oxidase
MPDTHYETLIIGGGLAGLSLALRLAESGHQVCMVAKGSLTESSSNWAQGGIAAAVGPGDTPQAHASDTISAGGGLCNPAAVDFTVDNGPACIQWLMDRGVTFTGAEDGSALHLTREGGHSERRVVHAADATGNAIMTALYEQVAAHPNITILVDQIVIDLITAAKLGAAEHDRVLGAYVLDRNTNRINTLSAQIIALATGGASKVYLYTSNMDTATGDGIAMAWRAGCRVANLEFVQFHPTCLYHPHAKSVLISEAVRGEGGRLLLPDGTRFMPDPDERA